MSARLTRRSIRAVRGGGGGEPSLITTTAGAVRVAEQLGLDCNILLELYIKETFTVDVSDVSDVRLVSVPPQSSQLDARDKLWRLHFALLQCRSLLENAIAREDEELGGGVPGLYEEQRKTVKDRLEYLLSTVRELRAADGGGVLTSSVEGLEFNGPTTLHELKVWVYRVFKEVDYWTKMAVTTLQGSLISKEPARTSSVPIFNRRRSRR